MPSYGRNRGFSFEAEIDRQSSVAAHAFAVADVLTREGYSVTHSISTRPSGNQFDIHYHLKKGSDEYKSRITIERSVFGKIGVREAEGFPGEVQHLLFNVSSPASARENAKGIQAVSQDGVDPGVRHAVVGNEGAADTGASNPLAALVVASIDLASVQRELKDRTTRRYIGSSGIGETCEAYHALSLRGFPSDTPTPRQLRIFRDGYRIERIVIEDLKAAGHEVLDIDDATGGQWEFKSHGDHHVCHLDGFIRLANTKEWMTLEVKSMNKSMFEKLKRHGVAVSHPEYFDQAQDQLGLVRLEQERRKQLRPAERCVFAAYCKDNSEYHIEIIEWDAKREAVLNNRVMKAMLGDARREAPYQKAFKCAGGASGAMACFKRTACWEPSAPEDKRCWHCAHARPEMSGGKEWACTKPGVVRQSVGDGTPCSDFKLFKVTPHGQ